MGVLFLDCGTGESKLVYVEEAEDGSIIFNDITGPKDTLPAMQTLRGKTTVQGNDVIFFQKFTRHCDAFKATNNVAQELYCGLTAWYRRRPLEDRVLYDDVFDQMEKIVKDKLGICLRRDTLAGFTEARYEHRAGLYTSKNYFGIDRLDLVVSGGVGSVQITPAVVYGVPDDGFTKPLEPISFDLDLKAGEKICATEGVEAYRRIVKDEVLDHVGPFVHLWKSRYCMLPGNVLTISAFFHAAKAAGLVKTEPKLVELKEMEDKLKKLIDDEGQSMRDRANCVRVAEVFGLIFSLYPKNTDAPKIMFARDCEIAGHPFRTTWTSGCFMEKYARSSRKKDSEVGTLSDELCKSTDTFAWSTEESKIAGCSGTFENLKDVLSQEAPCGMLEKIITVRKTSEKTIAKSKWNTMGIGRYFRSEERGVIELTITDCLPVVIGFFLANAPRDRLSNPRVGYSRRENDYGPCVDIGVNFTRDGYARLQIGSMYVPNVNIFEFWVPDETIHFWLETTTGADGKKKVSRVRASRNRRVLFNRSLEDICRGMSEDKSSGFSDKCQKFLMQMNADDLVPVVWSGKASHPVSLTVEDIRKVVAALDGAVLTTDVKLNSNSFIPRGAMLIAPPLKELQENVHSLYPREVTFDRRLATGPTNAKSASGGPRAKPNGHLNEAPMEVRVRMAPMESKLSLLELIKWKFAYIRQVPFQIKDSVDDYAKGCVELICKFVCPASAKESLERGHLVGHYPIRDIAIISREEIVQTALTLGHPVELINKLPFNEELICTCGMDSLVCIWGEDGECFATVDFRKVGIKEIWSCAMLPPILNDQGDFCIRTLIGIDVGTVHETTHAGNDPRFKDSALSGLPLQEVQIPWKILNTSVAKSRQLDSDFILKDVDFFLTPAELEEQQEARSTKGICAVSVTPKVICNQEHWDGGGLKRGHRKSVTRIIRHPDPNVHVLFTTSYDKKCFRWDFDARSITGRLFNEGLGEHTGKIINGALSSLGNFFATCGFDNFVCVWKVTVGEDVVCLQRLEGFCRRLMAVSFYPEESHRAPTKIIVGDCIGTLMHVDWSSASESTMNVNISRPGDSNDTCFKFAKHGTRITKLCTINATIDGSECAFLASAGQDMRVILQKFSNIEKKRPGRESTNAALGDDEKQEEERYDITFHLTDVRGLAPSSSQVAAGSFYTACYSMARWDDFKFPERLNELSWFKPSMEFRRSTLQEMVEIPLVFALGMGQLSSVVYGEIWRISDVGESIVSTASFYVPFMKFPLQYVEEFRLCELGISAIFVLAFAIMMIFDLHGEYQAELTKTQKQFTNAPTADIRKKQISLTRKTKMIYKFIFFCSSFLPVPALQALSSTFSCTTTNDAASMMKLYPSIRCDESDWVSLITQRGSLILVVLYSVLLAPLVVLNNDAKLLGCGGIRNTLLRALYRAWPATWAKTLRRVQILPFGVFTLMSEQLVKLQLAQAVAKLSLPLIADIFPVEMPVFEYFAASLSTTLIVLCIFPNSNPARYSRFRYFFIYFALVFWWTSMVLVAVRLDVQFVDLFRFGAEKMSKDVAIQAVFWGGQVVILLAVLLIVLCIKDRDSRIYRKLRTSPVPTSEVQPLLSPN
eukprot:GEMP01001534.1.p1 GENE.GEMP01001534.1~~GEMP01001534.1.p1  ORF type:complete len:1604 (+),score=321.48 GEMP01001534.1:250-5061(+)